MVKAALSAATAELHTRALQVEQMKIQIDACRTDMERCRNELEKQVRVWGIVCQDWGRGYHGYVVRRDWKIVWFRR